MIWSEGAEVTLFAYSDQMDSDEVVLEWVSALNARLRMGLIGTRGVYDSWDLSRDLLDHQPGFVAACQALEQVEKAKPLLAELRQIAISTALHCFGNEIRSLKTSTSTSGEHVEGYVHGLRVCHDELSRRANTTHTLRPDADAVLAQLRVQCFVRPAVGEVRGGIREVLDRRYDGWEPRERPQVVKALVDYLMPLVTAALDKAYEETEGARRGGIELLDALRGHGDLHITEPVTAGMLASHLQSFADAVRQDATVGQSFAAGFYLACNYVAEMAVQRAAGLRFPRLP